MGRRLPPSSFFRLTAPRQLQDAVIWPWLQPTSSTQLQPIPLVRTTRISSTPKANLPQPAAKCSKLATSKLSSALSRKAPEPKRALHTQQLPEVNKHGNQTIQNNDKVLHLFPSLPRPDLPVGGRLKYFKSKWYTLTKDPKLIEMVTSCPIKLLHPPPPDKHMPPIHMSNLEKSAAREHIASLLKKKAIVRCKKSDRGFTSSVFLVPKTDGGFRMILNLKEFNKYAEKIHFKMETLQSILFLVTQNCFMTNLDLVDAFLTVPLKRALCHLFRFTFEGQTFMYTSLPFGYTDSPRIFTKILKPVVAKLRSLGHILTYYLDDSWQSARSYRTSLAT